MALVRWEPRPRAHLAAVGDEPAVQHVLRHARPRATARRRAAGSPRWTSSSTDDHFVLRPTSPASRRTTLDRAAGRRPDVSGERKAAHEESGSGFYRLERATGAFSRTLTLPDGVDADAVQASFDKGVLEVRIPKPEQRKPRRVSISVGEQPKTIEGRTPASPPPTPPERSPGAPRYGAAPSRSRRSRPSRASPRHGGLHQASARRRRRRSTYQSAAPRRPRGQAAQPDRVDDLLGAVAQQEGQQPDRRRPADAARGVVGQEHAPAHAARPPPSTTR